MNGLSAKKRDRRASYMPELLWEVLIFVTVMFGVTAASYAVWDAPEIQPDHVRTI